MRKVLSVALPFVAQGKTPSTCSAEETAAAAAVNSATGRLFKGQVVARFEGDKLFETADNKIRLKKWKAAMKRPCDKWAVVTTINDPTDAIFRIVEHMPSWCLAVVGDENGPAEYPIEVSDRVVYLDPKMQRELEKGNEFVQSIPWRHFTRKNVGYFFAIREGAKIVFDFDDDNAVYTSSEVKGDVRTRLDELLSQPAMVTMEYKKNSSLTVNPMPYMGCRAPSCWPRGFPLPHVREPISNRKNYHKDFQQRAEPLEWEKVGVIQSLADVDPDVDAIYRMTQPLPMDFPQQLPLLIPQGALSPYNAQASLHFRNALWGMLLPITIHPRVADIWRAYIVQRLFWDVDLYLGFSEPLVIQERNSHNYIADLNAEDDLYQKGSALVEFLANWQGKSDWLPGRIEQLWIDLYERNFIKRPDVLLVQNWIQALLDAGYEFPKLSNKMVIAAPWVDPAAAPRRDVVPDACDGKVFRVLVTGINGMIGSHVARELVKDECRVVYALVRVRGGLHNLVGIIPQLKIVYGDITDPRGMRKIIGDIAPHYIYHFAAQANNEFSQEFPYLTLDTNVQGTLNVLEGIRVNRLERFTKLLVAGSSTEYGITADTWDGPIPEHAPLEPVSPYGVSKLATEAIVMQHYRAYGIHAVVARIFVHVASGGTEMLALQNFAQQVAMAEAGQQEPVIRHGNLAARRDMTDVLDSAPVFVKLEMSPPGEAYNLGSGMSYSIMDILKEVQRQASITIKTEVDPSRFRHFDEREVLADVSKIKEVTGWVPNPNMTATVSTVLDFWRREVGMRLGQPIDGYKPRQTIST